MTRPKRILGRECGEYQRRALGNNHIEDNLLCVVHDQIISLPRFSSKFFQKYIRKQTMISLFESVVVVVFQSVFRVEIHQNNIFYFFKKLFLRLAHQNNSKHKKNSFFKNTICIFRQA
jgi:hypothetical protein